MSTGIANALLFCCRGGGGGGGGGGLDANTSKLAMKLAHDSRPPKNVAMTMVHLILRACSTPRESVVSEPDPSKGLVPRLGKASGTWQCSVGYVIQL